jgi:hypothetical protein
MVRRRVLSENSFFRSLGTWVVLFADGHVKSMRPTRTMSRVTFGVVSTRLTTAGLWAPWGGNAGIQGYVNCEVPSQQALLSLQRLEALYRNYKCVSFSIGNEAALRVQRGFMLFINSPFIPVPGCPRENYFLLLSE